MSQRPLHIALTADPELPVPPRLYGGIERVIDMLIRQLAAQGHRITLFAHRDSATPADLVPWPASSSQSRRAALRHAALLAGEVRRRRCDLVHSFSRVAYLLSLLPQRLPKLMTYQRPISRRSIQLGHALSGGSLQFSGISEWMLNHVRDVGHWHVVPNGVPLEVFPFRADPGPDAPLVFLGRVEAIKGPHLAIAVARRTGLPLVIAGNVPPEHQAWFDRHIAPELDHQIRFMGPVDDQAKAALLGGARAFLMPILWDEPFGIVMAEAMACGTPVLGLRRGAVPEVVAHGVTGSVVDTLEELVAAVAQVPLLQRQACRERVERLYSAQAVAEGYLQVYRQMLARSELRVA